jgi:hypothetical protein
MAMTPQEFKLFEQLVASQVSIQRNIRFVIWFFFGPTIVILAFMYGFTILGMIKNLFL